MRIPELSDESRTDIFIRIYGKLLSQFDSMSAEVIFLMMFNICLVSSSTLYLSSHHVPQLFFPLLP